MAKLQRKRTDIPAALRSIDVKAILRKRGVYLRLRQNLELKQAAIPVAREMLKGVKKPKVIKEVIQIAPPQKYMSFADEVVETYKLKTIHNVETLEEHFDRAINKFLVNTLLAKALDNLNNIINDTKKLSESKTKKMVFDSEDKAYLVNQATIELEPYLQNMATITGQDANQLIGLDDPYIPSEQLRKRIQGNVRKFTESMVETDQDHLSDLIVAGIDDGKGVPEISSAIKSDFVDYSANQATRITRTEVLRSANQSAVDAFKQSGVVEGKQWVIAGTIDECAGYDGEIVTLDNGFYGSDSEFQDGDPPLHPNCKCVVIPVLESSSDDDQKLLIAQAQKASLKARIQELEDKADKRTKAFKDLHKQFQEKHGDDAVYIKSLEKHLGIDDESK
jgi:SPP1 gp7 family putative phage head morphogenesis protein